MRKVVLTFGLIAGGILSVMMCLTIPFFEKISYEKAAVIGYTTMVLAFLMVFFGIKSYRDNVAGGRVSFWRALQAGLLMTAIATTCYVATWEVIYYRLMPDFMDKYTEHALERAKQSGLGDEELARKTTEMNDFKEMYKNPLVNIAFTALEPLPVGVLFTFISAGVLSRRKRRGEHPASA